MIRTRAKVRRACSLFDGVTRRYLVGNHCVLVTLMFIKLGYDCCFRIWHWGWINGWIAYCEHQHDGRMG